MLLMRFEPYSYFVWLLGQRQLLLSLLGFVLVLIFSRTWRRQSSASALAAWLFFLSWLVWAPLVFTPEMLQGFQSPIRNYWITVAPADVFTLCSQSMLHRLRTSPLAPMPGMNWNLLVISGWALLAMARMIQLWRRRRRYTRIAAKATLLDDPASLALVERWRQAYRLRRAVQLRTSSFCQQAFTIGLFRPIVHVPESFLHQLEPDELNAVIGHEMAHVKRCDDLVIRLQRLLRAFFFFNPIITVANRKIAELREQCCDRLAMEHGELSARQYGKSLLRVLALNQHQESAQDEVAGLNSTPLRRRLASLVHDTKRFSWLPLAITALCLSSLSLLFGHTGSDPVNAQNSGKILAQLGAVSPVPGGQMTSKPFIWPNECVFGSIQQNLYHPGVDFAVPEGKITSVRSIAAGRVIHASPHPQLYGGQVHIRHQNGIVSTYLYLYNPTVQTGDRVAAGEEIAHINNTGQHHSHIHLEVHQGGRILDPSYLLTIH